MAVGRRRRAGGAVSDRSPPQLQIDPRRSADAAAALLGEQPQGTIVTDRYSAYSWLDLEQRQLCLAHLLRDFQALSQRRGAPGKLGRKLDAALGEAFAITGERGGERGELEALRADLAPVRQRIRSLLERGTRSRDEKARRFTSGLLELWPALWTFTRLCGVTPTNNTAERALRHAVIWRKLSHGTQTDHGNRLVERLLSIRETCRLNGIRPHDYFTRLIDAGLTGQPAPSALGAAPT